MIKMVKKIILFSGVLLAMFLVISGCGGQGSIFKIDQSGGIEQHNFRSGTDGISMSFIEGMPPSKDLYVGSNFAAGILIENKGAYDIKDRAEMTVSSPDRSVFLFPEGASQQFMLAGRSLYLARGETSNLRFPAKSLCFPGYDGTRASKLKNYTTKLKATACYYYETVANADLCIDPQKAFGGSGETPVCSMAIVSLGGGQGGPVGVTKISPSTVSQGDSSSLIQLSISIEKLKGLDHRIFNPSAGCDVTGQNEVMIEAMLGNDILVCEPSIVKVKESGSVATVCRGKVNSDMSAYKTPVSVSMKYYVQQSILKDVPILTPPGGVDCGSLG